MKKVITGVLLGAIAACLLFTVIYLMTGFVQCDINSCNWSEQSRETSGVLGGTFGIILWGIVISCYLNITKKPKSNEDSQ